jgi:hypothetical protein
VKIISFAEHPGVIRQTKVHGQHEQKSATVSVLTRGKQISISISTSAQRLSQVDVSQHLFTKILISIFVPVSKFSNSCVSIFQKLKIVISHF